MNKKILTRVLSFALVICMLVPVLPNLGFNFGGVTAEAAMPSPSSTSVLFKTGSRYYWKSGTTDTQIPTEKVDGEDVQPKPLYSAGSYYLPVGIVNTLTSASLSATATFNGVGYIKVTHGGTVTGSWKTYISNMGFIQLTTGSDTISSASDDEQVQWIKSYVFDHGSNSTGALTAPTVTPSHPYLLADQAYFDYLNDVYTGAEEDATLLTYLLRLVSDAEGMYNTYSTSGSTDGVLNSTWSTNFSTMTNGTYGYDGGGRQQEAPNYASKVESLAFAYQVTRDVKFAKLSLNIAVALSAWPHWGAGHFLNAADTAYHMALAYDWCYNAWNEISSANLTTVKNALFTKGVMAGVYDSIGNSKATYTPYNGSATVYRINAWYNPNLSGGSNIYNTRENNWNGVCSSGMILASLALIGETGSVTDLTITAINSSGTKTTTKIFNDDYFYVTYKNGIFDFAGTGGKYKISQAVSANGLDTSSYQTICLWLINNNLYNLEQYGLAQYVPDGSYIESASYWGYGTNSIFRTIAALDSVYGHDFGLSAAWGFDKTAYFANYAQDSNGLSWRYHDDNSESIDTSMNGIYGAIIGDENLVGYRKYLLEKGAASPTVFDALYYDENVTGFAKTELDYYMPGIEGYSMRSSWENDSAYVAFMGGPNYVNHGQVDSGAFVYHNNGVAWFQDIGTENYNSEGFGYGTQTNEDGTDSNSGTMYYPQVAEGNNTVAVSGYRFGQAWSSSNPTATITEHASNAYGGYAILDQTNIYGATSSRAILMTNNRKTVVIQDEITLKSSQNAYWIGHVYDSIKITIADEGKTAYLTDGKSTIRCTLVQPEGAAAYTFTVEDATEHYISSGTASNDYSELKGGITQNDYSAWQKLVVKASGVTSFKLAIVIEEVAVGDDFGCGYEWTDISSWSESMLTPDEYNYDDKLLLSKDFDVDGIGTLTTKTGNLKIGTKTYSGDSVLRADVVTSNSTASSITLAAAAGKVASASIGNGLLVAEFDLMTASTLPATTFALYGTDIYPIVEVDSSIFGNPSAWVHVTMVLDEENDMFYVYVDDTCKIKQSFVSSSYENLKLVISTAAGTLDAGSLLLNNVVIRTYTETYTALDSTLNGSTVGSASGITSWEDTAYVAPEEFTGEYVAKICKKSVEAPDPDDDTPVVDLWGVISGSSDGTEDIWVEIETFAELETAINSGEYTHVEIFTNNTSEPIVISQRIVVDTNGHEFIATSENLICEVSGEIHTYKAGSIRVAFIVNGSTYYATYRSTELASFQASEAAIGILKGIDNGDGTYNYVMTVQDTWSLVPYGDALTGNELIVTSENKTFYLTGDPYSGYFITVNGSTVHGYNTIDEFFTIMANSNSYDKIVITNDMYIESSNSHAVNGTKNLYLNGYTVTYAASGSSNHFMTIGNAATKLNVYGPGTLNNDSLASNIIMRTEYSTNNTTFNNLTINSKYVICDHREGTLEFNNCVINMELNRSPFSVSNRSADLTPGSNADNGTVDETQMAILVLNGGVVNAHVNTGNNAPVSLKDNSRVVLKGGVVINSPSTSAAIYVSHSTPTNINGDTSGIDKMYIHLGEYYVDNCKALYHYENNTGNTGGDPEADVDVEGHIYRVEGAGFTSTTTDYPLADGHVLAKTGSEGYAYKVVKTEDAATVIWSHKGVTETDPEYWVEGATPVTSTDIKNYLAGLTAADGKKYTCDLSTLKGKGVVAGGEYTFEATEMANLELRIGIDLYADFSVSIYVKYDESVTYNFFMINGVRYEVANCELTEIVGVSGQFYKIAFKVDPKDAAELIVVSAHVNGTEEITAVTSVLNYAKKVLSNTENSEELHKLMYSIVQYIGSAAAYAGDRYTDASCKALLAAHTDYKTNVTVSSKVPDTGAVKDAVKSVYLDLSEVPTYAFRFQNSFSGTVTISYTDVNGKTKSVNVVVENGKVSGTEESVYMLQMKAYDMASDLTITVEDASSEYNLDNYYTQAVQSADALYDLICALKSYCETAQAYKKA